MAARARPVTLRSMKALLVSLVVLAALAAGPAGAQPSTRLVLVADPGKPLPKSGLLRKRDCIYHQATCRNGIGGIELAYGIAAKGPPRLTTAVVLTDENCTPDRFGVSHCLNKLRLASGRLLTVRHDHRMGDDPCLSPGEHVRVVALGAFLR